MLIDMVKSFVVGIFPRSPKLINIWKAYERGEVTEEEFKDSYLEHIKNVVDIYIEGSLDVIHDPQSNWHDHFRPFTYFEGLEAGPLTRFYENNKFYRRPIFREIPKFSEAVLKDFLSKLFDSRVDGISIPGPHMWITHSIFKGVDKLRSIEILLEEVVRYLVDIGYRWVFLHEPSLVYYGDEVSRVEKLYKGLMDYRDNIVVYTYFGKVNDVLNYLGSLGFKFSVDMRWNSIRDLSSFSKGPVILGIIDGQNTLLEDPEDIKRFLVDKFGDDEIWICNNVDLDFLPYDYALKKVWILSRIGGG